jgi:hypothetical protein
MINPSLQLPTRLFPTEQDFTRYFLKPATAVRPEDLLDPDYWVHTVTWLRPNDRLEIVGTHFEIDLRVIRIDTSFLNPRPIFRLLRVWPPDLEITPPELRKLEYRIERAGDPLAQQHVSGSISSMHLEYVLRYVQPNRSNLIHGRLLR